MCQKVIPCPGGTPNDVYWFGLIPCSEESIWGLIKQQVATSGFWSYPVALIFYSPGQ